MFVCGPDYHPAVLFARPVCLSKLPFLSAAVYQKRRGHQLSAMLRIGFIGAGKMAQALAKGFIQAGIVKGEALVASCDPTDVSSKEAFQKFGAQICSDNRATATASDILFLAVKPHVIRTVLDDIKNTINDGHLLISVAMGTSIRQIETNLAAGVRVVRVMPNTPALVRRGASVFSCGQHVTNEDMETTRRLLRAVGTCDQVPETYLDPITALSGSGPAYVYLVMESLADGGVRMGLPRDLAYRLASQTVLGAAHMVQETQTHPAILRENVTSPGGSTAEGLFHLEEKKIRAAIIGAVEVATKRCIQAKQSG